MASSSVNGHRSSSSSSSCSSVSSSSAAASTSRRSLPGGKVIKEMGSEHLTDAKFRSFFNAMRLSKELCDVTIVVEGQEFAAHKLILSGCSSYFRGMFRAGSFDESQSSRILIDPKGELGIKAEAVEELISYVYTGNVEISHQNVIDLIRAADLLELAEVKNETLKVIEEHITFETYLDIRDVGNVFNCPRLLEAVDNFIRKNFCEFAKTQAFLDLEESELVTFLKHNELRVTDEEAVFEAALSWCKNRSDLDRFSNLSKHIRFHLISVKYLLRCLRDNADIRSNPVVSNCLLDRMESLNLLHTASRPRFATSVLVAMPYRSKCFYHITFLGDQVEFEVKSFPEMIHEHIDALVNYSICKVGSNHLFMAGGQGYNGDNEVFHSDRGFLYDVVKDLWSPSSNMPGDCSCFGMTAVGNVVYVSHGNNSSDEVLKMDFSLPEGQREWIPVSRTNYNRSNVHMTSVGGKLFAIGGMLDGGYTSTVEVYEPENDLWHEVDSMSQARCNPGVTVAGGKIYVVGGLGDNLLGPPGALKTVEYYDPEGDLWTSLPDMYFPRHSPAVTFVNNKLYVFGGGSPSPLLRPGPERTIECFDITSHEWFVMQSKIPGRSNAVYVGEFFDCLDT